MCVSACMHTHLLMGQRINIPITFLELCFSYANGKQHFKIPEPKVYKWIWLERIRHINHSQKSTNKNIKLFAFKKLRSILSNILNL